MGSASSGSATWRHKNRSPRRDGRAVENYFNYYTEIEEHFCRRRGTLLPSLDPRLGADDDLERRRYSDWKLSCAALTQLLTNMSAARPKTTENQRPGLLCAGGPGRGGRDERGRCRRHPPRSRNRSRAGAGRDGAILPPATRKNFARCIRRRQCSW